jgi:hypothetical protein
VVADPFPDVLPEVPLADAGDPLGEDGPPVEADAPPVSATPMPAPLPSSTALTATEVTTRLVRPDHRRAGAGGVLAGSMGSNWVVSMLSMLSMALTLPRDHG